MKITVKFRILTVLLLLLFVFSLSSCEEATPKVKVDNRVFQGYFDTVCVLYDYTGMKSEELNSLSKGVETAIAYYDSLFDSINESEGVVSIATLNRLAGTGPVEVSGAIIDLLTFSEDMYRSTNGKVNFAMGAVTLLWKSCTKDKRIPTEAELSEAGEHISPSSVIIDRENSTVEITDSKCKLDLGAIAKGYTAELIKKELKAQGYSGLVLDMGGNLCAVGAKPDGEGWNSGIRNPLYFEGAEEPYLPRTVTLLDDSLVTSGVYERYYVIDGVRYHHIIDPVSLMPENRYLSVSIQTSHSGVADVLSTAIFNMDIEEAEDFVNSFGEKIEVTFVFSDGSVRVLSNN